MLVIPLKGQIFQYFLKFDSDRKPLEIKIRKSNNNISMPAALSEPKNQLFGCKTKSIRFSNCLTVYSMHTWSYAHKMARVGCWEQYARDRDRFENRIKSLVRVIEPVLTESHREKMFKCYGTNG